VETVDSGGGARNANVGIIIQIVFEGIRMDEINQ
jgi:hypothetical protein